MQSVFLLPGKVFEANALLVEGFASMIHQIGYEEAILDEAREFLGSLKR